MQIQKTSIPFFHWVRLNKFFSYDCLCNYFKNFLFCKNIVFCFEGNVVVQNTFYATATANTKRKNRYFHSHVWVRKIPHNGLEPFCQDVSKHQDTFLNIPTLSHTNPIPNNHLTLCTAVTRDK